MTKKRRFPDGSQARLRQEVFMQRQQGRERQQNRQRQQERERDDTAPSVRQPFFAPGEVCGCLIRHGDSDSQPVRPAVLIYPKDGGRTWAVMGLTLSATYRDGNQRVPIPDWQTIPLQLPGYLWGPRLAYLPLADVRTHIGWAPPSLRQLIVEMCGWSRDRTDDVATFLKATP